MYYFYARESSYSCIRKFIFSKTKSYFYILREKGRYPSQRYDNSLYINRNVKRQSKDTKNNKKITQRLGTDLGRSVGVTPVIQLL